VTAINPINIKFNNGNSVKSPTQGMSKTRNGYSILIVKPYKKDVTWKTESWSGAKY
jgi:hypothetical protein